MNKRFYTKIFSILLLCLAGLTAFGQQRVYQNYDYSISIVPKGDGPVLENKGINLSLGAPLIDGGTSEVEILVTAAVSDPNISKNDKGIKKSKYKGNIYNVGSPINTISYQIRLNNGSSKSGTVEYPCSMSCAIRISLGRKYKWEEFANLGAEERVKKFVGQFGIASFKVTDVTTNQSGIDRIEKFIANEKEKQQAGQKQVAQEQEQVSSQNNTRIAPQPSSSPERGSASSQPRQQSNYEENVRKYNEINRQIATVDKVHNEFNNALDKVSESLAKETRAAQQRSAEVWEEVKAAGAEKRKREAEIAAAETERIKREENYNREDARIRSQIVQNRVVGEYDDIGSFSEEGLAKMSVGAVVQGKGYLRQWGFIDKTGKEIVPPKYRDVGDFSEGLASVTIMTNALQVEYKSGFIDKTGSEVIPLQYDGFARSFSEGLASVKLNDDWGFIDKNGQTVIPFKYYYARSFSEGLAAVRLFTVNFNPYRKTDKWGFIDKTDNEVIPFEYDGALSFTEGLAWVRLDGKWGVIDKTGNEVISFKYDNARTFTEGLACVKFNGKWGVIDKTGNEIISFKYDNVSPFSEGLACVKLNGKYGFIDKTGVEVTPLQYDFVKGFYLEEIHTLKFNEGMACVGLNEKYGFIDTTGTEVIPCQFDRVISPFSEGVALVKHNDRYFYIDKTGKEVKSN